MKRIICLLTLLVGLTATSLYAQEICNNGIDDDKDGFIDCFDGECAKSSNCIGGYLGNDLNCEAKPSKFPEFLLELESQSADRTTTHLSRVVVGDIDRDGLPEMITTNYTLKKIVILNGESLAGVNTIQKQLTVSYTPAYEDILIGNLDNDNCAEIFVLSKTSITVGKTTTTYFKVYSYDCNLVQLWSMDLPNNTDPGMMGLADFNGDGKVELYVRNAIYNAHTGAVVVAPGSTYSTVNGGPVAVDILSDATTNAHVPTDLVKDDNLELVCGGKVYAVDIAGAKITEVKTLANFGVKTASDATSIADYNNDGSLDVIASGKWTSSTPAPGNTTDINNTTIFFWDLKNNAFKTYSNAIDSSFTVNSCSTTPPAPSKPYVDGWKNGTGRVNIADVDGDGKLNCVFVSGKFLYALDENLLLKWRKVVNEETSGNTGCTLFDFNGDGQSEIVYRDERWIYIIDGKTGNFSTQKQCVSRTNREYPVVADVDGDGNTEICVACRTEDFYPDKTTSNPSNSGFGSTEYLNFCNDTYWQYGQVRVFRSGGEPWVPARRVWNQHGYFNVNVNDDLTIPKVQQKHHLVFSSGVCTIGPNRPLNSFLNQSPFLNSQGCPKYASPDITYVDNSLTIAPPTCPDGKFTVSFKITNKGDLTMNGDIPVTFYNGNPTITGSNKLNTINLTLSNFKVGDIQSVTNATVNGPGSPFTLYVVLNDDGTTNVPITLPNTNTIECNYVNNILSAQVIPKPVAITGVKVQDNYKCSPSTSPDNGAVRAFVQTGAVENSTDYNFYWSIGTVAKPIASADFKGAVWTGRAAGTYTVYAIHKTAGCASDTTKVIVKDAARTVAATIKLVHAYDHCSPANGAIRVILNDPDGDGIGEDPTHFDYEWYAGNDIFTSPLISINDTLSGAGPLSFTVLVKDKITGCQTIESFTIPDQTVIPSITATATDATCSDPTSGNTSANVNGVTTGYIFKWYIGSTVKPTADFTGPVYANRGQGNYTVVATSTISGCISAPVVVTVGKSPAPIVSATVISDQTSCDVTQPTGSASASVGGTTAGYTFEWFKGQNILPANKVASASTATGLTNTIYTVKATSNATGCFGTTEVTIKFAIVTNKLSVSAASNPTKCVSPNGTITIGVSPDAPSNYTFSWYMGSVVKATPDFADTDETLSGLAPGEYTVKAVNNVRHCQTAAITIKLLNAAPVITFNLTNIIKPNTCSDNTGLITVDVNAAGNTSGFNFEWRKGQDPYVEAAITTVSQSGNSSTVNSLKTGLYTLIATNRDNGCISTHTFDLPFDNAQAITSVSKTDVHTCVPGTDATLTVSLTPTPTYKETDYIIYVYSGKNDLVTPGTELTILPTVNTVSNYTLNSPLSPGFYTVVALSSNSSQPTFGCRSVPTTVEIIKDTEKPVFTDNPPVNNMNCGGAAGSGELSVTLVTPTTNASDYNFDWYAGVDASAPLLPPGDKGGVNGEVAKNLVAGTYTVVITKTSGTNAGCFSTASYDIYEDLPLISLSKADIKPTNIERCDQLNNGAVRVDFVRENGTPFNPSNYDFEWYSSTPTGPQLIGGATTNILNNQPAGIYYVRTINKTNNCSAGELIEVEILDNTMNTVTVGLVSFVTPTTCLKPVNIDGAFEVIAGGTSAAGYSYNWYDGQTTASPALSAAKVSGTNGEIAQNLVTGFYTIEVVNNTTQCKITDTYELPVDKRAVTIATSAEPMTVCYVSPKDGAVFATVTSGNKNDYTYSWYNQNVKATADFTSTANTPVVNLTPGRYIVIATDNFDATCFISDTLRVNDERNPPVVTALALSPLTICDPARPDGVASASVGGEYINFSFDWYAAATPAGTPFYNGVQASSLNTGLYSVIGTSILTGCSDTTQVNIEINQAAIPIPAIDVLSLVTSCIEGNGAVMATVGGNTSDYIFNWYNGTQQKNTPDFIGENYYDLNAGSYSVTATSRFTGCTSPIVTDLLTEEHIYPEFTWTTVAAVCTRDASEPSNGLAAVFITNAIDVGKITWETDGGTVSGPILSGVHAGTYKVTVATTLGCESTKEIEIKSEIHPYNGISRNNDGKNELFFINCIESFPSNSVKIFNRAGTLVYEADGYDNSGTFFDGKSNKGISIMGNNLPGGTYFYIIDKHDGSKPVAGYLELL